jgi:hypothetical protein
MFNPAIDSAARLFGTHSLRRTKATLIYRRTGNLTARNMWRRLPTTLSSATPEMQKGDAELAPPG